MITNVNDLKVYKCLTLEKKPMTRDEIQSTTNLPRTTVYDSIQRLKIKCLVNNFVDKLNIKGKGRPKTKFYIPSLYRDETIGINSRILILLARLPSKLAYS